MITITIPIIPVLFAILFFIIPLYTEIDESDRIFAFVMSVIFSSISFFTTYGLFLVLGAI